MKESRESESRHTVTASCGDSEVHCCTYRCKMKMVHEIWNMVARPRASNTPGHMCKPSCSNILEYYIPSGSLLKPIMPRPVGTW